MANSFINLLSENNSSSEKEQDKIFSSMSTRLILALILASISNRMVTIPSKKNESDINIDFLILFNKLKGF